MKNYFYSNEISQKIKELLNDNLPEEIKNISTGDFTILPAPDDEDFAEYFPAVVINLKDVENEAANQTLKIYQQEYTFYIYYLYPYRFKEFEDTPSIAKKGANKVANVLISKTTLDDFNIEPTDKEAGGVILASEVKGLTFDNAETEVFKSLEIPVSVAVIEYIVAFRTYQEGAKKNEA